MAQLFGCWTVPESTVGIKEHFGKFVGTLEPGFHCIPWCFGYQIAGILLLNVKKLDLRCETKTKDNVLVNVVASVRYQALPEKAEDAYYYNMLSVPREQIREYVCEVIRAYVPKLDLDAALEQKDEIARPVQDEVTKAMSAYGYEILQTLIVDIEPDAQVKRAMDESNEAAAEKVEGDAAEKVEGEEIMQIEGEAESTYLSGLGAVRDSVLTLSENVMDMVLRFHPSGTGCRQRHGDGLPQAGGADAN